MVLTQGLEVAARDAAARNESSHRRMNVAPTPSPRTCGEQVDVEVGGPALVGERHRREAATAAAATTTSPNDRHTIPAVPGRKPIPRRTKWRPKIDAGFHAVEESTHPSR